ncbi:MAG TPA: thioesterase family protein [Sandaracinaceae bacterium]
MFELDRDTTLDETGEGVCATRVSDAWGISGNPNGGYLAVLLARAIARALPHPDPFTLTAHYLSPPRPGDARVLVERVRVGRAHSTGVARLEQDGKERVRAIATFGDLAAMSGPTREEAEPPPIPPLDACEVHVGAPPGSSFAERMEERFAPGSLGFLDGKPSARMELGGWMRFADGRPTDVLSLLLFADAMPPPVLHAVPSVWVPTLELTIHVRRRPAPGWIRGWFRTRHLVDGYLEEDGELWDESGRLVALSRQLARVHRG